MFNNKLQHSKIRIKPVANILNSSSSIECQIQTPIWSILSKTIKRERLHKLKCQQLCQSLQQMQAVEVEDLPCFNLLKKRWSMHFPVQIWSKSLAPQHKDPWPDSHQIKTRIINATVIFLTSYRKSPQRRPTTFQTISKSFRGTRTSPKWMGLVSREN